MVASLEMANRTSLSHPRSVSSDRSSKSLYTNVVSSCVYGRNGSGSEGSQHAYGASSCVRSKDAQGLLAVHTCCQQLNIGKGSDHSPTPRTHTHLWVGDHQAHRVYEHSRCDQLGPPLQQPRRDEGAEAVAHEASARQAQRAQHLRDLPRR